jgi:hypothetical protein
VRRLCCSLIFSAHSHASLSYLSASRAQEFASEAKAQAAAFFLREKGRGGLGLGLVLGNSMTYFQNTALEIEEKAIEKKMQLYIHVLNTSSLCTPLD